MLKSYKIVITGQVQGVGFRPFVYVLAHHCNVKGTVSNNEDGVIICVTGIEENILAFYKELVENPPRVSRINGHRIQGIDFREFDDFQIIPSEKSSKLNLQLTPDFAICDECRTEISDRKNRRFKYPFTTCVNCGPRWAITNTFPFERDHTSISEFEMCDDCKNEYTDPENRRFHSQTNSCSRCGISIQLTNNEGKVLKSSGNQTFKKVAQFLAEGSIVALKNTGGYLLCCDATNKEAVQKLRDKKNRPNKPFAILYPTLGLLQQELTITDKQIESLSSTERPIVIIPKNNFKGNLALAELAPNLNQLGIMLPYSGILQLLAEEITMPIVATSGNLHGSPIISDNEEAYTVLQPIADYFLHHNLKITNPQDDSVVKYSSKFGHEVFFRRSRGYSPNFSGKGPTSNEIILAMGGHLKSTIAFLPNDYLYISQYLGNLDHYDVYNRFTKTTLKFIDIFEQKPGIVLIDKHPAYLSTLYGIELSKKLQVNISQIQHHKAHFASVLGEHALFDNEDPILGVIWDGTGYGDDAQIWGGEFFRYHTGRMERISHFEYFDWLAGDKMAKEPRLSFFSLADHNMQSSLKKKFSTQELGIYGSIKRQSKLKTSSVGRLFDAVASLLNICDYNTYEGEAAILLENSINGYELENCLSYCNLTDKGIIPVKELFFNLYSDFEKGMASEDIIINFLFTLATLVFQMAAEQNSKLIAFSGGVFQNTILVDMLKEMAKDEYKLYFNRNLSPNDENISFGQISHYLYCKDN